MTKRYRGGDAAALPPLKEIIKENNSCKLIFPPPSSDLANGSQGKGTAVGYKEATIEFSSGWDEDLFLKKSIFECSTKFTIGYGDCS